MHLPIREEIEREQGLSHARNRALKSAKGERLIWIDDDVFVEKSWLSSYLEAFNRWPEASYFAGAVLPYFEAEPPRWLSENLPILSGMLVKLDYGLSERKMDPEQYPVGANMAFRRDVLTGSCFNPNFGKKGQTILGGDETFVFESLSGKGNYGVWVPSARVQHFIPPERQSLKYVWAWFVGAGRTQVRKSGMPHSQKLPFLPPFFYWALRSIQFYLLAKFGKLISHPRWLERYTQAARSFGFLTERARR